MLPLVERIRQVIACVREKSNISQNQLAKLMNKSRSTIQSWENGPSDISLLDFINLFEALKVPIEPYAKWIARPELFPNGLHDIEDFPTDQLRRALVTYYAEQAAPDEVLKDYFILFSDHGSNKDGVRELMVANMQCPLSDRKRVCTMIISNYREAQALGRLSCENGPLPNMDTLSACYEASKNSIREGKNSYTVSLTDQTSSEPEL